MKKKLMVVSSNRADLGLLLPVISELKNKVNLDFVLTGSHSIKKFGFTEQIVKENIKKYSKINIGTKFDNEIDTLKIISKSIQKFSSYIKKNKIATLVLLGDRFEIFSVAICAFILRVPIIHIHGGETTSNAMDNAFRHSISQMSSYHFVAHDEYKRKLINFDIDPKKIFNMGSLGAHSSKKIGKFKQNELRKILKIKNLNSIIMVSYHPETLKKDFGLRDFNIIIDTLKNFSDHNIIFFKPNFDPKNNLIASSIKKAQKKNKNMYVVKSLSHKNYLSLMSLSDLLIGNSSSGIIESPSFKLPVINIGKRQNGRIISKNIITITNLKKLKNQILYALSDKFKDKINNVKNPFYKSNTPTLMYKKIYKIYNEKKK